MQPTLSVRIDPDNPNHHLWNNHGTWWLHYTVHPTPHTKRRGAHDGPRAGPLGSAAQGHERAAEEPRPCGEDLPARHRSRFGGDQQRLERSSGGELGEE